ncbi:MAG: acyl-CoA dehydratase activase [Candidatus Pacebacteria bacterium]|nr:acyl-CoA dehydratase activase [Candidatus Paceibacterota bacterium]
MRYYLGIDVGSISTKFVLIDQEDKILDYLYLRTEGDPIRAVKVGLEKLAKNFANPKNIELSGIGATGSGRYLARVITGADLVKNEITAQAKGASFFVPDVRTVIEIGGQDSKIIILENGVVVDFGLNLICAAGTGSFLDAQAFRLGIPVEEFGKLALKSKNPTHIGSRCTVFCESDMIHKQQVGHKIEDIVAGLCQGLARNFLANVGKGKKILPPIVFQGGVSENLGMRKAFEEALGEKIIVPKYNTVMGAFGVALLTKEQNLRETKFRGWEIAKKDIRCTSFQCQACPNQCEIIEARIENKIVARWGDRCGKWSDQSVAAAK